MEQNILSKKNFFFHSQQFSIEKKIKKKQNLVVRKS